MRGSKRAHRRAPSGKQHSHAAGRCKHSHVAEFRPVNWDGPPELPNGDGWFSPVSTLEMFPRRTKHRITKDPAVTEQRKRFDQFVATMNVYGRVLPGLLDEASTDKDKKLIGAWMQATETCGDTVRIYRCKRHGKSKAVSPCCHAAICPREQRRRSQRWAERLSVLAQQLPNDPRGKDYRRIVALAAGDHRRVSKPTWKMVTISLKQKQKPWFDDNGEPVVGRVRVRHVNGKTIVAWARADEWPEWKPGSSAARREDDDPKQNDSYADRLDRIVEVRARLVRLLNHRYGMLAGVGAIEMGSHCNVHLHFLTYCSFLPREEMQRWLRSYDCTVPGCDHPADDRCAACKQAGHACTHPLPGGHSRCNGSWYIDIRQCYVRPDKIEYRDAELGGIVEACKYAAAPVIPDDAPRPGAEPSAKQLAYAREVMRFFLALHGRHRVETYGLARPRTLGEEKIVDDVTPKDTDEQGRPCCPVCEKAMDYACTGERKKSSYDWFREKRARAAPG